MKNRILLISLFVYLACFCFAQKVEVQNAINTNIMINNSDDLVALGKGNIDKVFIQNNRIDELKIPGNFQSSKTPDIDLNTAKLLAISKAKALWGGSPKIGSIIPINNPQGDLVAYDVDFKVDGSSWSDYKTVASDWRKELLKQNENLSKEILTKEKSVNNNEKDVTSNFGRITISATYDRFPIIASQLGVSNFYASGWICKHIAENALNDQNPELTEIYFMGPWERGYRFVVNNKSIIVIGNEPWNYYDYEYFSNFYNQQFMQRKEKVYKLILNSGKEPEDIINNVRKKNKTAVNKLVSEANSKTKTANYIIGYSTYFEPFEWHYGCAPTAAAMVLNYWENYSWYGKLNYRFFREYDSIEGDLDCHIPNMQYYLKNAMGTDPNGGTAPLAIYDGMKTFANNQGYSFDNGYNWTGSTLGWQWDEITNAINENIPFVWTLDWFPGSSVRHMVAAVGYDDASNEVKCYSTWSTNGNSIQSVSYSGGVFDFSFGASPAPGGQINYDAKIISPDGGTTFSSCQTEGTLVGNQITTIHWNNYGNPGHHVNLFYSTNGGVDWHAIAGNEPDDESYDWSVPNINTSKARVLIQQYSSTNTLVSSDGSYGDFNIEEESDPPFLSVFPTTLFFSYFSGSQSVNVTSNVSWQVTDDKPWISTSPTSGSNNGTVNVSVTENTSTSSRSGTVTISGGGITRTVSISQDPPTVDLNVSPTSLSFNSSSGTQSVSVTSNAPSWQVTDDKPWIDVSPTSGSNNGTVNVSVTENTSASSRNGTVTISGGGITRTVGVTQDLPVCYFDITPINPPPIPCSGGTLQISITSNTSWSVTGGQPWMSISPTSGSTNGTVTVSVTQNTSSASRTTTLTFYACGTTKTITITQEGCGTLTVSPPSLSFTSSSSSQSVNVTSNVSWSVTDDKPWISTSPTSGSNNGTVTVSVTENTTTSSRNGTVTISGGGITKTVSVSQDPIIGTIVWPGDANNDGVVNAADVLNIGLFYGLTGPPRIPGGCTWEGQTCPSGWSPPNAAYADCNGDGTINAADVLCIGFNYGKTHSLDVMSKVVGPSSTNEESQTNPQVGFNFYDEYGRITSLSEINDGDIFYLGLKLNSPEKLLGTAMEVSWSGAEMKLLDMDGGNGLKVSNAWSREAISMIREIEDENKLAVGITDILDREKEGNIDIGRIKMIMESKGEVTIEVAEAMGMNKLGEYVKINGSKIEKGIESTGNQATEYRLSNYPNPFNPTTRIRFSIPTEEVVSLRIYNSLGEEVAELVNSEKMGAGEYEYSWDASKLSSGIYFYSLQTNNKNIVKKMLLIK